MLGWLRATRHVPQTWPPVIASGVPSHCRHVHASSAPPMISLSASRPPAHVGDPVSAIDTPALVLDLPAFEANCQHLVETMTRHHPSVRVRPHTKAHKTPAIAALQLKLLGSVAQGVCCQKVCEAEAMWQSAGIANLLVSNQVVAPRKIQRLVDIAAAGARVSVCVDNQMVLEATAAMAQAAGTELGVVVEVDAGQARCGVDSTEALVCLAQAAVQLPGVAFQGLQAYHGGLQHVRDPANRRAAVGRVADIAQAGVEALAAAGVACPVVTGGGSGTYREEASSGVFTEVQPGSFAFGDADYARNKQADGRVGEWQQSVWVLTEVMSVSQHRRTAVVDAGLKASSFDSGPPVLPIEQTDGVQVELKNGGDEHGILLWPPVWQLGDGGFPEVGTRYRLQPGHVDPTFNMYDWVVGVRDGVVEGVWPVLGRGPGQ